MSIPYTWSKLLELIMRASVINQYFRAGAQLTLKFVFTATSSIAATAKFIRTYIIAWFWVKSSSSIEFGFIYRRYPIDNLSSATGVSYLGIVLTGAVWGYLCVRVWFWLKAGWLSSIPSFLGSNFNPSEFKIAFWTGLPIVRSGSGSA